MTISNERMERQPVDWARMHDRIAALGAMLNDGQVLTHDEAEKILAERARALALPGQPRWGRRDDIELLVFRLADETFATESRQVVEVVSTLERSRLPGSDPPVSGLAAWRGELLPIVDLAKLLRLGSGEMKSQGPHIVAGADRAALVVAVEEVLGIQTVTRDELLPLPADPRRSELLRGTTRDAVVVLTLESLIRTYS